MNWANTKIKITTWYESCDSLMRFAVLATVLFCIWAIWQIGFVYPVNKLIQQKNNLINSSNVQIEQLYQQIITIQKKAHDSHWKSYLQTKQQLNQKINILIKQLELIASKAILPNKIPDLISAILTTKKEISIVSVNNLPATPWLTNKPNGINLPFAITQLKQYPIEITVKGNFFTTLNYINQLENLPWKLHWQTFIYQVTKWPEADIKLSFYVVGQPSTGGV